MSACEIFEDTLKNFACGAKNRKIFKNALSNYRIPPVDPYREMVPGIKAGGFGCKNANHANHDLHLEHELSLNVYWYF